MKNKKTVALLLALAALLTLAGFVPTGLRLYAALNEPANPAALESAVPIESRN